MDVTTLCDIAHNFPRKPEPYIHRPHIVTSIDLMLNGSVQAVILEGGEGAGKTTLASEFSRSHSDRAFSLFAFGSSSLARSPEFLAADLADQLSWYGTANRLKDQDPFPFIRKTLADLRRKAAAQDKPFYFVLDGLLVGTEDQLTTIWSCLSGILPIGIPGFKFLITGDEDRLSAETRKGLLTKAFVPPGFSPDEVRRYLNEFNLDDRAHHDLFQALKGDPGKVASVRRILQSGQAIEDRTARVYRSLDQLSTVEWNSVGRCSPAEMEVVAMAAHAEHPLSLQQLAKVCGISEAEISALPLKLSFLACGDNCLLFVSTSFKQFAANKLLAKKRPCLEAIIRLLLEDRSSVESVEHLPDYLRNVNRGSEVLDYLTPDHLSSVCDQLRSLGPVKLAIQKGMQIALELKDPVASVRFALQQAVVTELEVPSVLASEVDAQLEVSGTEAAKALAAGAFLSEDRMQLLSRVIHYQHKHGEYPDPGMVEEVRRLAGTANLTQNPMRALEIAGDLIGCLPDVAMRLVEATTTVAATTGLDLALARLSILAADTQALGETNLTSADAISERINNVGLRQLVRAGSHLAKRYTVEQVLRRCDSFNSAEESIFLLERWCVEHRHEPDAWRATDYGIRLILRTATYTPTARTFRLLCAPLPYSSEQEPHESNKLLKQVDAQAETLCTRGPAVEYVRLQLCLAETEATWDSQQALSRIESVLWFVNTLKGPTHLDALARCIACLALDETGRLAEHVESFITLFEDELEKEFASLLVGTAEHSDVLSGSVTALSRTRPALARKMIAAANTAERRDILRFRFVHSLLRPTGALPTSIALVGYLDEFEMNSFREGCLSAIIDWLYFHQDTPLGGDWTEIYRRGISLSDAPSRHQTLTRAYILALRTPQLAGDTLAETLKREAASALRKIDSFWTAVDFGFSAASEVAQLDRVEAVRLYGSAIESRKGLALPSESSAVAYIQCVKLAIRAFIGLVRRKQTSDEQLCRLRNLISKIPSPGERARLWADLALRCFAVDADSLGKVIAQHDLETSLHLIADNGYRWFVLKEAAPALFKLHYKIAFDEIDRMPREMRDSPLGEIATFLITGQPGDEPFDEAKGARAPITWPRTLGALDCIERMTKDHMLFAVSSRLTSTITQEDSPLTRDQKNEVAQRMEAISQSRLPSPTGVSHEGYKIAFESLVAKLRSYKQPTWEGLALRARAIPNLCDRVLVLSLVAEAAPTRVQELRMELILEARALADAIPCEADRLNRLFNIALTAAEMDGTVAKECLRAAFSLPVSEENDRIEIRRRALVDLAFRIDPAFAKSLVALLDDDPARRVAREQAQRRIEMNETRRDLAKDRDMPTRIGSLRSKELAELCWSLISGLHSGRVSTIHVESTIPYLVKAGSSKLAHAYPVLAWSIENSVQRHDQSDFGNSHLLALFDTVCASCDLAVRVISRASGYQHSLGPISLEDTNEAVIVVAPGQRDEAMAFLRQWLDQYKPEYLKICDPYFCVGDLGFLALVRERVPDCRIEILTSDKKQREEKIAEPFGEAYRQHWRLQISDQDPPDTDIMIVSISGTGDSPIHDRWIVTRGSGLRLGSSFSGLGMSKTTEISVIDAATAAIREEEINRYLTRQLRYLQDRKVNYSSFSLT